LVEKQEFTTMEFTNNAPNAGSKGTSSQNVNLRQLSHGWNMSNHSVTLESQINYLETGLTLTTESTSEQEAEPVAEMQVEQEALTEDALEAIIKGVEDLNPTIPKLREETTEHPEEDVEEEVADNSTIIWWNCAGGILSKIDFLKNFLASNKPFIFFISEAEINSDNQNLVQIKGYDILLSNTINGEFEKSRSVCYIREDLTYNEIKIKNTISDIVAVEFEGTSYVGIYKGFKLPSGQTPNTFLAELLASLNYIVEKGGNVVIGGDFNIDLTKKSKSNELIDRWAIDNGLTQWIHEITRTRVTTKDNVLHIESSLLDHLYSNFELNHSLINSISDHVMIQISEKSKIKKKTKIKIRDWKDFDQGKLNKTLANKL